MICGRIDDDASDNKEFFIELIEEEGNSLKEIKDLYGHQFDSLSKKDQQDFFN